jgi:hypothetical protein
MVSIRIASCSSPRPSTLNASAESVGSTRMETFVSSSFSSRSLMLRDVTHLPSRPAKGEVLTEKIMEIVGSSMRSAGSGAGFSAEVTVSPMPMPSTPASATISPQRALSASTRRRPSNEYSFVIFVGCIVPSRLAIHHLVADLDAAREDAADAQASQVVAVVQVRDQELEGALGRAGRRRHVLHHRLEQRPQVLVGTVRLGAGVPVLGVRVEDRELELLLRRVEVDEEVVDLVQDLLRARVGRSILLMTTTAGSAPPAPCAARSGSAAAGPRRRPPAA